MCCPLLTGACEMGDPVIVPLAGYVRNKETCADVPEETTGKTHWS